MKGAKEIRKLVDEEYATGKHKHLYLAKKEVAKRIGMNELTLDSLYYKDKRQTKKGKLFDIVAFKVPEHKSLIYKRFQNEEELLRVISLAITKGANVMSIRRVKKPVVRGRKENERI